jgi:hypothetical protein
MRRVRRFVVRFALIALPALSAAACTDPPFSGMSILLVVTATAPSGTPDAQVTAKASLTLMNTDAKTGDPSPITNAVVTLTAQGGGSTTLTETNPDDASDYEGTLTGVGRTLTIAVTPPGLAEVDRTLSMPDLPTLTTNIDGSGLTINWSPAGEADETEVEIRAPVTGQGTGGGSGPGDPGTWLLLPSQFTAGHGLYELDVERSIESGSRGGAFDAVAGVTATTMSLEP